jgi:hypothetical protein
MGMGRVFCSAVVLMVARSVIYLTICCWGWLCGCWFAYVLLVAICLSLPNGTKGACE